VNGRRADVVAASAAVALVGAAAVVGWLLNRRHVPIHANAAPLFADWRPHLGPGTVPAVAIAVATVACGPSLAARLPWRRLLPTAYLAAAGWTFALALVDGWARGLAGRLTVQAEYLSEVPRVHDIPATLRTFTSHVLDFQPGSWSTHTAGHPPGALLVFALLDRIGLHGGGWAAVFCAAAGATVAVSIPVTLRALGEEAPARAAVPFLVLFPGAVWIGASADAFFAAVCAAGLACLAARRPAMHLLGGVLLGLSLYLSYGLVLAGLLAVAVIVLARRPWVLVPAGAGVALVAAAFTVTGFWWLDGYRLVLIRYQQGWAADRPYSYWVWADLACLVLSAGPVAAPILRRAATAARRAEAAAVLPIAAAAAMLLADLSGLSKAEVERIWLPYAVWLAAGAGLLPVASRRWWLAAQAVTALAVNHLLQTNW
jgi:hypothetical protein